MSTERVSLQFSDGISLGPGHCIVIVDPVTENFEEHAPNSVVVEWSAEHGLSGLEVNHSLTRIISGPSGGPRIFVAGRLGYIGIIEGNAITHELIEGPDSQGFITDIGAIGKSVYAVGMGRQAYRRLGHRRWQVIEQGMDKSSMSHFDVTGLNSITGFAEDEIYAVGFHGEIWQFSKHSWENVDSPTNVILECARAVDSGENKVVYAAGQSGVLLRGRANAWEILEQAETTDDFWDIEWFSGKLYLATAESLFRLKDGGPLERVEQHLSGNRTYSKLNAANGALWSIGPNHLSWTEDGEVWNDVDWNR